VERQVMSTPSFLAWTLLNAGCFALCALVIRRVAVAKYGILPPISGMQSAFMALMAVLLGAQLALLGGEMASNAPSSPLTRLLSGAIVSLIGVSNLYRARKHGETYPSQRTLGAICLALGAVLLVIAGYSYAISLGTAASWSVL
jgi:hypothetical protein